MPRRAAPAGGGVAAASRGWRSVDRAAISSSPGSPGVIFFSAAYLAAASLTIGAITLSSEVYQSDVIFQFLPSQVWMRPVRAPS